MNVSTLARIGSLLALGAALSIVWFGTVVHRETGALVLTLGLLSLGLVSASSLCFLFALAKYVQGQHPQSKPVNAQAPARVDGEYVARYSWADRAVALAIAVFFGGLTALLWLRSARPQMTGGCGLLFAWATFYAAHITGTQIRFTRQGFIARVSWLRNISESYDGVECISGRRGTLKVQFSDGRSLKFHTGLGNPDMVIAHLKAKCPESIHLQA
jgi:hypothetical protein